METKTDHLTFDDKVQAVKVSKLLTFIYTMNDENRDEILSEEGFPNKKEEYDEENLYKYAAAWAIDMTMMKLHELGIVPVKVSAEEVIEEEKEDGRLAIIHVALGKDVKFDSIMELSRTPNDSTYSVPAPAYWDGVTEWSSDGAIVIKNEIDVEVNLCYLFE